VITRILLADDHAVLRGGLRALLNDEPDMEVVGEAGDGAECIEKALSLVPDVVVLDINMPVCNGLDALEVLQSRLPLARVVVLTMHDDLEYVRRVIGSGGAGYILKQSASDELIKAIRAVVDGGMYVSPAHARLLLETGSPRRGGEGTDPAARLARLSERESEVFTLVAQGHTNLEIAQTLAIGVKTVETHRARLMRKLEVDNRAALVRLALELGLLK
jgi:two-component system, NarL family, response regulator NreC